MSSPALDHADMADILVLGGGLNGLSTAALLARDGHQVTVLERDPAEPIGSADMLWDTWNRRGVNQFHLPHFMLPRWRGLMEQEIPGVIDELVALGGLTFNVFTALPAEMTGAHHEDDERFDTVTGRRPVVEAAVATAAANTPGVTIRRGVAVTGLTTGPEVIPGVPHVTGVLTNGGMAVRGDLVVDATGRRSPVGGTLEAIGGRRPAEQWEDSGFVYYGRHFRSADGRHPATVRGHRARTLRQRFGPHPALRQRHLGDCLHRVCRGQGAAPAARRCSVAGGARRVSHGVRLG